MNAPPFFSACRKCTFDMFNFLASQHRVLPEGATCDEEEDEVQLRSTRYGGQARVLGWSERVLKCDEGQKRSFLGTSLCVAAFSHQTRHQPGAAYGHALSPPQEDIQRGCGCL